MSTQLILGVAGLLTLLPAALLPLRGRGGSAGAADGKSASLAPDAFFWLLIGVATLGTVAFEAARIHGGWHTGFGASLWATIAATMLVFVAVTIVTRHGWRLATLLLPYLFLLGILGTVWTAAPEQPIARAVPVSWLAVHIVGALATYALLTLGAVAAFAVWLKERAIRNRRHNRWTASLPSVIASEKLLSGLLLLAETVLAVELITGMASQLYSTGTLLVLDHKTLLSLAAFIAIGAVLVAHYRLGMRGQRAARFVLLAWLLLTLAYPGVKFVTDILV